MNKNILIGILILVISGLTYFLLQKPENKIVKIPVTIEVPIPGKTNTFPPVELPIPKKEKPRPIDNIPDQDKDSILQDALTERDYEEIFKDSIQEVTVKSKVQGKLLKQEVGYNIYPSTIKVDTIIEYKIPPSKIKLYGGIETGIQTDFNNINPVFQGSILLQNRKDNIIKLGFDTNNRVNIGYYFKF